MGGMVILGIIAVFVFLFAINPAFAQSSETNRQTTLSKDLENNPVAQDILAKIEQTKKMIEDLKQKDYEKNQARESLEKMRNVSIERLTQDLEEWERLWAQYDSRGAFETFVSKRPSYVQELFWDQFEFKEQKVNAGRIAMERVLASGGTMQDARNAYLKAASIQKIELMEMNAQFNVKHNLADHAEQQFFNSTGQIHLSPTTQSKLAQLYGDYKLQPSYILANSEDQDTSKSNSEFNSNTQCGEGLILVSRVTSETNTCVDESIARKWIDDGVRGIVILDDKNPDAILPISDVKTNPETDCGKGYQVIYNIVDSEYQCVLESIAKKMISDDAGEIHTLTDFILNKDKQKTTDDEIYEINQRILRINEEYDAKKKTLESKYEHKLEDERSLTKQKMQDIVSKYKTSTNITKEDVTKLISEVRTVSDSNKEKITQEKLDALHKLELELKHNILKTAHNYANNPSVDVDWDYLNDVDDVVPSVPKESKTNSVRVSSLNKDSSDEIRLDKIGIVNSFGQQFDEIKSDQLLQVAADITNSNDHKQDFVYLVEVKNNANAIVQPAKWVTGTLNPNQTLNVGLSWIPEEVGDFKATVSTGTEISSATQIADIEITVNPEGDLSDDDYCKDGHELLFKYSDNSPICATSATASKLINIGLAFD